MEISFNLCLFHIILTVSISIHHINPFFTSILCLVNNLDHFLCSHIDSLRRLCPIVDQTSDEIIEHYGDLFFLSFFTKNSASSSMNGHSNHGTNNRKERKFQFIERYLQFLTHILMIIEMYSKYIQNELNDHIDTSRNLWKNLNMEDGRSLDGVEVRNFNSSSHFSSLRKTKVKNFLSLRRRMIDLIRKFLCVTDAYLTVPLLRNDGYEY